MIVTKSFLIETLNTVKSHITVVNEAFTIVYTNKAWTEFGEQNDCSHKGDWFGINYLKVCEKAAKSGDEYSIQVTQGIKALIAGIITEYTLEYPCHSPTKNRWFMMQIERFTSERLIYYVISHQDITERVELEAKAKQLATMDGLTAIANRRTFDEFVQSEFQRCKRVNRPISLAIIDIDDFKLINDKLGHQVGDNCLKKMGQLLSKYAGRQSDLCARYGGEEFALVWGDLSYEESLTLVKNILTDINQLVIESSTGNCCGYLKASIGLAFELPRHTQVSELIRHADQLMYQAKSRGKNQICTGDDIEQAPRDIVLGAS